MPVATPIAATEEQLAAVSFNDDGLVPAVVQEHGTGQVLMLAWMNEESLRRTLETGRTWFWSRSRQEYWCKGETSGDRQWVRQAFYDCDGDVVLVVVEQEGRGACSSRSNTVSDGGGGRSSGAGRLRASWPRGGGCRCRGRCRRRFRWSGGCWRRSRVCWLSTARRRCRGSRPGMAEWSATSVTTWCARSSGFLACRPTTFTTRT